MDKLTLRPGFALVDGKPKRISVQPKWAEAPIMLPTVALGSLPIGGMRTTLPNGWCEACREPRNYSTNMDARRSCPICGGDVEHVPELAHVEIAGPALPRPHKALPAAPPPEPARPAQLPPMTGLPPGRVPTLKVTNGLTVPVHVEAVIDAQGVVHLVLKPGEKAMERKSHLLGREGMAFEVGHEEDYQEHRLIVVEFRGAARPYGVLIDGTLAMGNGERVKRRLAYSTIPAAAAAGRKLIRESVAS